MSISTGCRSEHVSHTRPTPQQELAAMSEPHAPGRSEDVTVISVADLAALTLEPNWPNADPDGRRLLVVDLETAEPVDPAETARLADWLGQQPVPCVALGSGRPDPLAPAFDLLIERKELASVASGILANPAATSVLVEVLRSVVSLPAVAALTVESLGYATLQGGPEFARWLARERQARPARSLLPRDDVVELNREDERLSIVLNSPETRNSLSAPMRDALSRAFEMVAMDRTLARVEVSGRGPCFSAGGDLGEFGLVPDTALAHRIRMLRMPARYLIARPDVYSFTLHGGCIGAGIELPAFAPHLRATRDAYFQLPELTMGLIPGAGGCVSISRRIGRQRAARMMVLGERVDADRALRWGLIDEIVD
jgi:enoyl-CoA hydratase